jgi:hypothetical protein
MLVKAGTVKELAQFEKMLDRDLYLAALRIVKILDEVYGADRDVEHGDGGFVLIAENVQDVEVIERGYEDLNAKAYEAVDAINCESGVLINAFFLHNNEFGVNILIPLEVAPKALLNDLPSNVTRHR